MGFISIVFVKTVVYAKKKKRKEKNPRIWAKVTLIPLMEQILVLETAYN